MVEGIVLAAGSSNGTKLDYKLTLMLGGQTVLEHSIGSMKPFCSKIFVVSGANRNLIEGIIDGLSGITPVYNADFLSSMYGSVRTGLRATTAEKVLILPGDCPCVESRVFNALLAEEGNIVLPEWRKHPGHPVLLTRTMIEELLRDDRYESLQEFIATHTHKQVAVDCAGILRHIDTVEDYRQALRELAIKDEWR